MGLLLAACLTFLILSLVPVVMYGLFSALWKLPTPKQTRSFFTGVVVQKLATTFGLVALFVIAQDVFDEKWLLYGSIWFVMYAVTEIGQAMMSEYTWKEALAGVISEALYFPLAALVLHSVL